jgi:lipoyl-dependent peroxiredoxin
MATTRQATTRWTGSLLEGRGETTLVSSGVGTFPVSWASRSAAAEGKTSPEELIAAAHSSCFCMALSSALAKNETPAASLECSVEVDFVPGTGITEIRLNLTGDVPGLSADQFAEFARGAKENCPVSKALAAVPITLHVA